MEAIRKWKTANCKGSASLTIGLLGVHHNELVFGISPINALRLCSALQVREKDTLGLRSMIPDNRTSDSRLAFGDRDLDIDSFCFLVEASMPNGQGVESERRSQSRWHLGAVPSPPTEFIFGSAIRQALACLVFSNSIPQIHRE